MKSNFGSEWRMEDANVEDCDEWNDALHDAQELIAIHCWNLAGPFFDVINKIA